MWQYLIRRLILLPITLFFIVLINFGIINLAPGDPVTQLDVTNQGAARSQSGNAATGMEDRYLQFREFFGLTLPVLWNNWPQTGKPEILSMLTAISNYLKPGGKKDIPAKEFHDIRLKMGDMARFVMPKLLQIMEDPALSPALRATAAGFFIRGGTKMAYLGPKLTTEEKRFNEKIVADNYFFKENVPSESDSDEVFNKKVANLHKWYEANKNMFHYKRLSTFFFETRFFRYMSRVLRLDFGMTRNDPNKTVVSEVVKRFKYSLTLSIIPMFITFFIAIVCGMIMALRQHRLSDHLLNLNFLILYAIPVFVAAPFLIEKVALGGYFPFTNTPIPLNGFTSPDDIYNNLTSFGRFVDTLQHIALPLVAILYGGIAAQSRLSRTAVLEVMRQDYVRTARAKGLSPFAITWKHIGRNASITIVTAIAGSLGVILGGSLIVETLFEINGFGKFFYDAIINRDYNVIMFSALAGSFLTLLGYLAADISYTLLDPRVTLDK